MGRIVNLKKNAFVSAKISVNEGKLYGEDKIRDLVKLEFDEILRYLEEHGFQKAVDRAYLQHEGFYLVENILNAHLSEVYKNVFSAISKPNKTLIEAYYLKYQVHNMMVVVRCKFSKEDEFESYLIGDSRRKSKYVKAFEMPNIEDALTYMSKKLGFNNKEVIEAYKNSIFELENYLYKQYYTKLKNYNFKFNNIDEKSFVSLIANYVDLLNTRAFIKLKIEDSNQLNLDQIFIEGGKHTKSQFEELKNKSIDECMNHFKNYFGKMDFSLESTSVESIDKGISKHKKNFESMFKKIKFGSPFYPLKYLFEIEKEINMLRVLLKSKYLKISEEEILKLL